MRRILRLMLLPALLPACQQIDPHARAGVWRPRGANEANLRLHVATPSHLDRGAHASEADGRTTAAAVERYRNGQVRPLPAAGVSRLQATGQGGVPAAVGGGDGGR